MVYLIIPIGVVCAIILVLPLPAFVNRMMMDFFDIKKQNNVITKLICYVLNQFVFLSKVFAVI